MISLIIILILLGVILHLIKPHVEPALYNAGVVIIIVLVFLALLSLLGIGGVPKLT